MGQMRTFDWDGKPTPRLGFGCGGVLGRVGRRGSLRAMAAAWDAGVRLFDTARSYGYGEAEGLLGEFLRGRREQAIIVSKFGIVPSRLPRWKSVARPLVRAMLQAVPAARAAVRGRVGTPEHRFDVQTLRASLETSLRELRTESVDVLLAHEAPRSLMAQNDLMAELEAVVREGKARRVGVSAGPQDASLFLSQAPAFLSVVQFAGNLLDPGPEPCAAPPRLRMVNHPFGGVTRGRAVLHALAVMGEDPWVASGLREKLRGDLRERLAEATFASLRETARADVIVPSMLHPEHVRANVAAIDSDLFSPAELAQVRARLAETMRRAER
jgi:aryl-alcohol dehydrogenase-like predicted oxidoreductase